MKYLISGGGTGGHIFPAVSIADAIKTLDPDSQILFVGAQGRMEMERVPQAGYEIVGLKVRGFDRRHILRNIPILIDLVGSMCKARGIIRRFRPNVGIGVGGYASGAAMKVAAKMGVPILLQEQNGFAGVTNKLLKDDARVICVAYEGMEKFFPKEKLLLTGNPVRANLTQGNKQRGIESFNRDFHVSFTDDVPTLLIIGGSLGARTINVAILHSIKLLLSDSIQVIWQTGKIYYDEMLQQLSQTDLSVEQRNRLVCTPFLSNMPDAYAMADLVVSRAGASSISEICLLGKAAILVPSPNVAEDHQTHNAMALVDKHAAVLVKDTDADNFLAGKISQLIHDPEALNILSTNSLKMALPDSAHRIAEEAIRLAKAHQQ